MHKEVGSPYVASITHLIRIRHLVRIASVSIRAGISTKLKNQTASTDELCSASDG